MTTFVFSPAGAGEVVQQQHLLVESELGQTNEVRALESPEFRLGEARTVSTT